jgi:integrase
MDKRTPWGKPLDLRQFRTVFGHACAQAGIGRAGLDNKAIVPHPYTPRRTFLTHLAETGAPQSAMMALAGHSDFRATQVYLGSTEAAQREAIGNLWTRLELKKSD